MAGYDNLEDFAKALNYPRLSAANLRVVERNDRPLEPHERQHVADVCGIDVAFFDIDLKRIRELPSDPELAAQLLAQAALEAAQEIVRAEAAKRASRRGPGRRPGEGEDVAG